MKSDKGSKSYTPFSTQKKQSLTSIIQKGASSFFSTFERIAKKMLLAQIKANFSSDDDISSDEEIQEEDSDSEAEKERKQRNEENGTEASGEDSDFLGDEPNFRHHLLRHKLTLDEGTSENGVQKQEIQKKESSDKSLTSDGENDGDSVESGLEDLGLSEELSQSEDETIEKPKRSSDTAMESLIGSQQKEQVPYIWLSDTSDEEDESHPNSQGTPKGRKKIRKIIEDENLRAETQEALREEEERCQRLRDREQQLEELRESVVLDEEELSQVVTTKLVLDQDEETKKPLLQVHTNLVTRLKPHQVDGVQFIWDSCCESVKKANSSPGSGCILAHCMGLGKTLQVVAFLHTVLRSKELKFRTALVVCPLNTILNWVSEFKKWQADMGQDKVKFTELATIKQLPERLRALQAWQRDGGVMIMGYEIYRILSLANTIQSPEWKRELKRTLVDPGPDFVVCDEGHILRNDASNISKAMKAIKTQRRVVLTGTPLQNNLVEYHCMVSFIKKNLLGSSSEFRNRFINPIENGQCADSTPKDVRIMKKRAHVLHAMLAGCVQRRDYSELTQLLPPKHEYVLAVRVSPLQYKLYRYYLDHVTGVRPMIDAGKMKIGANLFKDFQVLGRIWTHPWCLHLSYLSKEKRGYFEKKMATNREASMAGSAIEGHINDSSMGIVSNDAPAAQAGTAAAGSRLQRSAECWYRSLISEGDAKVLQHSGKMVVLLEILRMAEELGDKVLVFSQSLISLDLIEDFLRADHHSRDPASLKEGSWIKNVDYYRLDGTVGAKFRKKWTDLFNDVANARGRLFLISTRAGSLGINLVAANRVVIFDASWNPSYDIQSIYRVYRFGQIKQVFVYRFLAQGTMEEKIYDRQVTKQSLSYRVVDQQQIERHFTHFELMELYTFEPDLLNDPNSRRGKRAASVSPKDELLAQLLHICKDHIVSFHEHESLLDHKQEEELSEAERRAAWAEYEAESNSTTVPAASSSYDMLNTSTNEQLQDLLNKCKANIVGAFMALQKMKSPASKDDMLQLIDSKEQEERRASYRYVISQQQSLTLRIESILNSRRNPLTQQTVMLKEPGRL